MNCCKVKMKKSGIKRNSSLELLRILAIVGVITLHYNNISNEFMIEGSLSQYYSWLTNCLSICAVNVFVLISAFWGCTTNKRKISKILELIIQFVLFRASNYFIGIVVSEKVFEIDSFVNVILPVNYYIILYSVLYIISPYINILIDRLSAKEFKRLTLLLFGLFSVETWFVDILYRLSDKSYDGLSTVGLLGSQNGFTIVNFVLLYFIGAYIRKNCEKICKINSIKIIVCLLVILFAMYSLILVGEILDIDLAVFNYNNPLIIAYAVLVLILFMKLDIDSNIINEVAKGVFTCFIIHGNFLPFIGIEKIASSLGFLVIHQTITIIGMLGGTYIVYKAYSFCIRPVFTWVYKRVPVIDSYRELV